MWVNTFLKEPISLHRTSGLFKVPREGALREAHGAERRPLRPEARGWGGWTRPRRRAAEDATLIAVCFVAEFRSLGKSSLCLCLSVSLQFLYETLGAGYLGARCLRDAGGGSWTLRTSEGLAEQGRPAPCGPAAQVRAGGRPHFPVSCAFPELCPPRWQTLLPNRAPTGGKDSQGCVLSPCLSTSTQSTSAKCWAGWSTSWNQDCWEKYE